MTFFISRKQLLVSYGNIDWCVMNVNSRQNLSKCILLVQRSPQVLIDYHTMLSPPLPTSLIRQRKQDRLDMIITKVKSITYHFLMKGNQNISSLHKIICSLVSLFLWYIMKVVPACKVSSAFLHLVSYKLISYLKENIRFNKLSIPYGEQQKAPWYFLVRMHIPLVACDQVIELSHQEYVSSRHSFWRNILTSFNWFWHQCGVHRLR